MAETPKFKAFIESRCPKCRRGKIFSGSMYSFRSAKMNEHCSHCGMKFEIEPGYFYAAMYISYALNVSQIIIVAMLTYWLSEGSENPWFYIGVILTAVILLSPFNYRYSRLILLHWLTPKIKYNPEYDK